MSSITSQIRCSSAPKIGLTGSVRTLFTLLYDGVRGLNVEGTCQVVVG